MFAVIKTGGKQYKVAADDILKVEKLAGEAGDAVTFDQVLMVGNGADVTVGAPLVDGALVAAELVETRKQKTVIVFKKNRRHNYRRRNGHRQTLSTVRITEILTGGKKPAAKAKAATKAKATETVTEAPAAEKAPAKAAASKPAAAKPAAAKAEEKKPAAKKAAAPKKEAAASAAKKPAAKKPAAKKPAAKADKE